MSSNVTTTNLQVNVLNRSQYKSLTPSINELYFVEDDDMTVFVKSVGETPPENPQEGDKYIDTRTNLLYTYEDGSWGEGTPPSVYSMYVGNTNGEIYVYDEETSTVKQIGGSGQAANVDNITTTLNNLNQIQASGVINKNGGTPKFDWVGTKEQYDALSSYNDNWIYYIVDNSSTSGNMSLNNVYNRLNAAWAWIRNGVVVYTVPSPVAGFKTYSNATNMTISSTITDWNGETSITDSNGTYTRDAADDTVFGSIAPDSKNQFLTVYDLLTAIKG